MKKIVLLLFTLISLPLFAQYDVHLYKHYCLEISAGVKNILDQFQRDLDRGPLRDAGYIYGITTPRSYFIGLALKI